jgi:biopolymer transport protein ExbD
MIEQPIFMSNKKVDNQKYFNFLSFANVVKYPIALDSGEKFEYEVTNDVIEDLKEKGISKIKAVVRDMHGKSHYSKWYEI